MTSPLKYFCREKREAEIIGFLLNGYDNREIAAELHIAERTVKARFRVLYDRHQIQGPLKRIKLATKMYRPEASETSAPALTQREWEILRLIAAGRTNEEIGKRIGYSTETLKNFICQIYDLLGMYNRTELALWYLSHIGGKAA